MRKILPNPNFHATQLANSILAATHPLTHPPANNPTDDAPTPPHPQGNINLLCKLAGSKSALSWASFFFFFQALLPPQSVDPPFVPRDKCFFPQQLKAVQKTGPHTRPPPQGCARSSRRGAAPPDLPPPTLRPPKPHPAPGPAPGAPLLALWTRWVGRGRRGGRGEGAARGLRQPLGAGSGPGAGGLVEPSCARSARVCPPAVGPGSRARPKCFTARLL